MLQSNDIWRETLSEVSQIINSTLVLNKKLDRILQSLQQVINYDQAAILNVTPQGLAVTAARGVPSLSHVTPQAISPNKSDPLYQVWQSQQPKIKTEVQVANQPDLWQSWLGVPLLDQGEVVGILSFASKTIDYYKQEHLETALIFATWVALVVKNSHLASEIEYYRNDLTNVDQTLQIISSHVDVHQVLQDLIDFIARVIKADNISIGLLNEAGQLDDSIELSTDGSLKLPPFHKRVRPKGTTHQLLMSSKPVVVGEIVPEGFHNPHLIRAGVKSYAGLPLKAKRKTVGILFAHSLQPHIFTEARLSLLTTMASLAAIAIENTRLYAREFQRANTIRALLEVEQEVTRNITAQSKVLLDKIARIACRVTKADCAVIYPYLAEVQKYDLANVGAFGLKHALRSQDKQRLNNGKGVSSLILDQGRTIIYDVSQDDPQLLDHSFIKQEQIRAFVGIRLEASEPMGILYVNYRQAHTWNDNEISLIELFASQAATAILNARLFGRTNTKLEQKVAELETVSEINQLITSTLDLNAVLTLILSKAMELVNVENVALQLIDFETGDLVLHQSQGAMAIPTENTRLKLGEGVTGKAVEERRSIIVSDVMSSPWNEIYRAISPQIRSELAVPLLIEQACIGVLNFEHRDPNYFTPDHCEIIEALAAQAAVAIQNARRYDELETTKDDLAATEAVAWIGLFGSSWAHSVTQKTSAVRNYMAVLTDYVSPGSKAEELLVRIEDVMQAIQRIPIAQQLPPKPHLTTTLDLDTALQEQVERWVRAYPNVEVVLDLNCAEIQTHIDREWLDIAMEKLITNALRAMPDGGQLKIISTSRNGRAEVKISDTGCGIAEKIRPYFLKEQIPREYTSSSGSGIGMLIARYIFRTYGGDLKLVWSEPDRGTMLKAQLQAKPITEFDLVQR